MPARKYSEEQRARIVEMGERGLSDRQIALKIGCSDGMVSWLLLTNGVDRNADKPLAPVPTEAVVARRGGVDVRRFTQAEDAQMLALEAQGLNVEQLGRALRRPANSIRGRLATLARRDARAEAQGSA